MDRWTGQDRLIDAIGQAVIVTEPDGTVRSWNAAAHELYGWTRAEALGRNVIELTPSSMSVAQAQELLSKVSNGVSWSGEFQVRHRGGREFPVLVTDTPLVDADGVVTGIVGVSVDISELHETRNRAQTRASQQAAVATLAGAALASIDLDELFERAVGLVAAELRTPLCEVLELRPSEQQFLLRAGLGWQPGQVGTTVIDDEITSQAHYTLSSDEAIVVRELATETRFHGSERLVAHGVVSGMSTVIRSRGGTFGVLGVHATSRQEFTGDDVAFLDAIAGVLGGAIAHDAVESELRSTVDALARSEEIQVAFLRATSHELRTPLSAVTGFAQTLRRHDRQLSEREREEVLERLVVNADRLTRLVADLLDVDRLASGLLTASCEPHDFRTLISRVLTEMDLDGRILELELAELTVNVDAPKMERVVANLVANALRHTPIGGKIRIGLERADGATLLSVEDEGSGIDPDYLERIFEPFVQGPDRHQDAKPGTGLGLNLVRELVALHGGRTVACNRPEGGARFEIVLPDRTEEPSGS